MSNKILKKVFHVLQILHSWMIAVRITYCQIIEEAHHLGFIIYYEWTDSLHIRFLCTDLD